MPAQPPSPESSTASVSDGTVLGTGTSGRSATPLSGATGATTRSLVSFWCAASSAVNAPGPAAPAWSTPGTGTSSAPPTCATNFCTAGGLHTVSSLPCSATQGARSFGVGSSTKGAPRARWVKCTPSPLHSGFFKASSGQKPIEMAPPKVSSGACASMA